MPFNYCNVCGYPNGHAPGCPEAPQPEPTCSCTECGNPFYNGDAYYEIGEMKLCEDCINDCKRILDVDEYTYYDYLEEEYERWRHDA